MKEIAGIKVLAVYVVKMRIVSNTLDLTVMLPKRQIRESRRHPAIILLTEENHKHNYL